jgi:quercetin dioxygenase-like cupin family protein
VVYEDQGEPFVMNEGDLVLQPPGIRHRVLESSAGLEVIEISAPALHETLADHELALPNVDRPGRTFGGQCFLHHVAASTPWTTFNGAEAQETELPAATGGLAEVRIIRPANAGALRFAPYEGELVFGFVLGGIARLERKETFEIGPADAFVIPPGETWGLGEMSRDFRLVHVTTARLDGGA